MRFKWWSMGRGPKVRSKVEEINSEFKILNSELSTSVISIFISPPRRVGNKKHQLQIHYLRPMDFKHIEDLKRRWDLLGKRLEAQFGEAPDVQALLFLIGVQELGKGPMSFTKDEKQDLMHIATCRLLSQYGYYKLDGLDEEGWPHWSLVKKLPPLTLKEQDLLLKEAIVDYFDQEVDKR